MNLLFISFITENKKRDHNHCPSIFEKPESSVDNKNYL